MTHQWRLIKHVYIDSFPVRYFAAPYQHVGGYQPVCVWWILQVLGNSTTGSGHPGLLIISHCHNASLTCFPTCVERCYNWVLLYPKINIFWNLMKSFWNLRHWWLFLSAYRKPNWDKQPPIQRVFGSEQCFQHYRWSTQPSSSPKCGSPLPCHQGQLMLRRPGQTRSSDCLRKLGKYCSNSQLRGPMGFLISDYMCMGYDQLKWKNTKINEHILPIQCFSDKMNSSWWWWYWTVRWTICGILVFCWHQILTGETGGWQDMFRTYIVVSRFSKVCNISQSLYHSEFVCEETSFWNP